MVVIRLARAGAKKKPFYHIVVANSRDPRDGRFIEKIGFYNPIAKEGKGTVPPLKIKHDRLSYWVSVGAQMSMTVTRLSKIAPVVVNTATAAEAS